MSYSESAAMSSNSRALRFSERTASNHNPQSHSFRRTLENPNIIFHQTLDSHPQEVPPSLRSAFESGLLAAGRQPPAPRLLQHNRRPQCAELDRSKS